MFERSVNGPHHLFFCVRPHIRIPRNRMECLGAAQCFCMDKEPLGNETHKEDAKRRE